jgi:hypothetical protein
MPAATATNSLVCHDPVSQAIAGLEYGLAVGIDGH